MNEICEQTCVSVETVAAILEERCDGGRNAVHALVSMCQPTSNKDADLQDNAQVPVPASSSATGQPSTSSSGLESAGIAALSSAMNLLRRASRLDSQGRNIFLCHLHD